MRVAKLVDRNRIDVVELPIPEIINPQDVQIRVMAVGVCGTDLHIFREGRADVQLPRVMGHELSGEVMAVGAQVKRIQVGDRVVLDPVFACGSCATCMKGYTNVCENVCCFGVQMDGGYQDYIVVDEKQLYPFDSSISYEEAALAEPFSIASNILERTYASDKDAILIIGCGAIGLSILQTAKAIGARVMVVDIVDKKLGIAKEMGADQTVNSKTESLRTVAEEFSAGGFDVVIDAVGITPQFMHSLEFAAPRARVACIGFDSQPVAIPPVMITKKELSIIGSRMNCRQFPNAVELLNAGKIRADMMISKTYSLSDIQKAFEETIADSTGNIKTLILFKQRESK